MKTSFLQLFLVAVAFSIAAQHDPCLYTVSCEDESHESFDYEILSFDDLRPIQEVTAKKELVYDLFEKLKNQKKGKRDILIVIHGMWGNDHNNFKRTSKMLKRGYLDPEDSTVGALLSFKWPSNNYKYKSNKSNAREIAHHMAVEVIGLARKLQMLNSMLGMDTDIHLLCHSLGNFLLEEMVEHLPENQFEYQLFKEIILAAPDLDTYAFEGSSVLTNLRGIAGRTSVYYNRADLTLKISEELNERRRLGRSGPSPLTKAIEDIYFIDATLIDDERSLPDRLSSHSYYRNSPSMEYDIRKVIAGISHKKIDRRQPKDLDNHYIIEMAIEELVREGQ